MDNMKDETQVELLSNNLLSQSCRMKSLPETLGQRWFSFMIFHTFSDQVYRLLICLIKSCYSYKLSNQAPLTLNLAKSTDVAL